VSHHAAGLDRIEVVDDALQLRGRYRAYRRRQARKLVGMLPTDAVRPLLRAAFAVRSEGEDGDGLEALVRFCEELLPLPPFEVWLEDSTVHPEAHLADLDDSADVPSAEAPATMDARPFVYMREPWIAHLRGFRDGHAWRGYIAFEQRSTRQVHRTSLIFREADPADLCARFSGFRNTALEAFLRSSLP
jgi:hypothetical protein